MDRGESDKNKYIDDLKRFRVGMLLNQDSPDSLGERSTGKLDLVDIGPVYQEERSSLGLSNLCAEEKCTVLQDNTNDANNTADCGMAQEEICTKIKIQSTTKNEDA